jgi:hypothetical protein
MSESLKDIDREDTFEATEIDNIRDFEGCAVYASTTSKSLTATKRHPLPKFSTALTFESPNLPERL